MFNVRICWTYSLYHENNERCHLIDICRGTILVNECYIGSSSHIKKLIGNIRNSLWEICSYMGSCIISIWEKYEKISWSLKKEGAERVIVQSKGKIQSKIEIWIEILYRLSFGNEVERSEKKSGIMRSLTRYCWLHDVDTSFVESHFTNDMLCIHSGLN